jgi:Domain of unknown function (DUF4276)
MSRVRALVEGQTEEGFVREVMAPSLGAGGVFITSTRIGKPGRRGGIRSWPAVRKEILATLRHDPAIHCTTMFDYYGLPSDWPGRCGAGQAKQVTDKAHAIEQAMHDDVCGELGGSFDRARFLPYIQMHEFEALLFCDTGVLAEVVQLAYIRSRLDEIVEECGEPEGIDDDPRTAPSKRIRAHVPRYQKVIHGIIAAKRMGLATMRERCPHFAQWIRALEQLGQECG